MYSLFDMLTLTGRDTLPQTISAAVVGLILPLVAERASPSSRNLGWHLDRIRRSVELDQLPIYFDRFGRLAGHALWTLVDVEKERALLKKGPEILGADDLASQGGAWVLDFHAQYGELPNILRDLRDRKLMHHDTVTYFRYKRSRRLAKRVTRADKTSFFMRPRPASEPGADWPLTRKRGKDLLFSAATTLDAAIELGRYLALMRSVDGFAAMTLPTVLSRLRAPLGQMQSRMYLSPTGEPTAFMTWAWLDPAGMRRRPLPTPQTLAPFEWNEGETLCLCDAVATPAGLGALAADLAGIWFPADDLWVYPRSAATTTERPEHTAFTHWTAARRAELTDLRTECAVVSDLASILWQEGAVSCLN